MQLPREVRDDTEIRALLESQGSDEEVRGADQIVQFMQRVRYILDARQNGRFTDVGEDGLWSELEVDFANATDLCRVDRFFEDMRCMRRLSVLIALYPTGVRRILRAYPATAVHPDVRVWLCARLATPIHNLMVFHSAIHGYCWDAVDQLVDEITRTLSVPRQLSPHDAYGSLQEEIARATNPELWKRAIVDTTNSAAGSMWDYFDVERLPRRFRNAASSVF